MQVQMKVNGKSVSVDAAPNTLLVNALREHLKLTGTHVGCDTAQCGACTVMVDGRSVKSCNVLAAQVDGAKITTIEGLAKADGTLHPMQAAFKECHGLQCGYCTPGMIMSAIDIVHRHSGQLDEETVRLLVVPFVAVARPAAVGVPHQQSCFDHARAQAEVLHQHRVVRQRPVVVRTDADGLPAGIFCANTDDTQRVISERQLLQLP